MLRLGTRPVDLTTRKNVPTCRLVQDMYNISNCISKYIKLWVFWKRGQCLSCCGLWIICLLLHLSENNVKITQFSLYLGVLFTWEDSHYQYQYGCSTNKSDGLKSLSFLISPVRNVSGLILYMCEVES